MRRVELGNRLGVTTSGVAGRLGPPPSAAASFRARVEPADARLAPGRPHQGGGGVARAAAGNGGGRRRASARQILVARLSGSALGKFLSASGVIEVRRAG